MAISAERDGDADFALEGSLIQSWVRSAIEALEEMKTHPTPHICNAIFTYVFINLHDAMKLLGEDFRVIDKSEYIQKHGRNEDLTELIRVARHVACHNTSGHHQTLSNEGLSWGIFPPQFGIRIDGEMFMNGTVDDTLLIFGGVSVYIERNIVLAINRIRDQLLLKFEHRLDGRT